MGIVAAPTERTGALPLIEPLARDRLHACLVRIDELCFAGGIEREAGGGYNEEARQAAERTQSHGLPVLLAFSSPK